MSKLLYWQASVFWIKRFNQLVLRTATMQSYIGTGYPVMFFNVASRGGWYDALRHGVVDARPPPQLLQPPAGEVARRTTRHFIADILDLRDDDDDDEDSDVDGMAVRSSRATTSVRVKRAVWTSRSPSPPSLSSNTDDVTMSPGSEQRSAPEDLRLTMTTCRHHSVGLDSCTSDSPPSDVTSDHGTSIHHCIIENRYGPDKNNDL